MAGPYPFSFRAAILKMMAGLVVVSMCAPARLALATMHCACEPQNTRTKASCDGVLLTVFESPCVAVRTARYT